MTFADDILDRVRAAVGIDPDGGRTLVVAAMSGGVDSTVVAGLLKAAGYNVAGITLQLYDHGEAVARKGACCAGQDIHDARKAAAALDIPHYVLDFESRFRDAVIEEFADAYVRGETPIPCVACNQTVKFADLLSRAKALGAACLATGHYIACVDRGDGSGHRDLRTPADMNRDQSYFLFQTTQAQADYLRFPLASFTKDETRDFARQMGLAIADKPDSQDICFVPDGNYVPVIERLRPEAGQPGDIVHEDGRVLGRHKGIVHYTIGQRRGIGIAAAEPLVCDAAGCGHGNGGCGAEVGAGARRDCASRCELAGRGRAGGRAGAGEDPLDAAAGACGVAGRRGRAAVRGAGRGGVRCVAGPGLCFLRWGGKWCTGAWRRLYCCRIAGGRYDGCRCGDAGGWRAGSRWQITTTSRGGVHP
jgi:tRNA (5-methylaminomethyl-2-thiouridylate)-methyltransferase